MRNEESASVDRAPQARSPRSAIRLLVPSKNEVKLYAPTFFRYIGSHGPNLLKKVSLAWFSNQAVLTPKPLTNVRNSRITMTIAVDSQKNGLFESSCTNNPFFWLSTAIVIV